MRKDQNKPYLAGQKELKKNNISTHKNEKN